MALLVGAPLVLGAKIAWMRRTLGRSPVVLGRLGRSPLADRWERVSPFGLLFWPAVWGWIAFGDAPLSGEPVRAVGMGVLSTGVALTAASVVLMGRAWRIGIDPENTTDLAQKGPYRWMRHPIYSGFLLIIVGQVLVVPVATVVVAAALTAAGIVVQALREEQHLQAVFGERWGRYAARTGRFAPRVWRAPRC